MIRKDKIHKLSMVIFCYGGGYHEKRAITKEGLGSAAPLTEDDLKGIAKAYDTSDKNVARFQMSFKGFIPENVKKVTVKPRFSVIWTVKQGLYDLSFTNGYEEHSGSYYLPNLVMLYRRGGLTVLAFEKWKAEKTKLYEIGFPNVNIKGNVCMGSAKVNLDNCDYIDDVIKSAEDAFFNSHFSHDPIKSIFSKLKGKKNFDYKLLKKTKYYGEAKKLLSSTEDVF